uniref:Uncharacterized protein n=1 Tax=Arundo donax TaxID=35708 RepID=A0A0A8ZIR2_ARUDO
MIETPTSPRILLLSKCHNIEHHFQAECI